MTPTAFRILTLTAALGLSAALTTVPAMASPGQPFASPEAGIALPFLPGTDAEIARRGRGADDGAGHVRGGGKGRGADDGAGHTSLDQKAGDMIFARRGRGADDAPGHVRGGGKGRGRGADDAPNHG